MKYRVTLGGDPALIPSSAVSALFSIAYTDIDKQLANWPIGTGKKCCWCRWKLAELLRQDGMFILLHLVVLYLIFMFITGSSLCTGGVWVGASGWYSH
jgi:hypothetical protein